MISDGHISVRGSRYFLRIIIVSCVVYIFVLFSRDSTWFILTVSCRIKHSQCILSNYGCFSCGAKMVLEKLLFLGGQQLVPAPGVTPFVCRFVALRRTNEQNTIKGVEQFLRRPLSKLRLTTVDAYFVVQLFPTLPRK